MAELVNAVGGGTLGVDLDLVAIAKRDDIFDVQYEPEMSTNLSFRLQTDDEAPTIMLYRTGKFSIAGANSIQELKRSYSVLREYIKKLGLNPNDSEFEVRYLVFNSNIGSEIDLAKLYDDLDPSVVEYEPEQFPQLKYEPEEYDGVFMISRTGNMIYTGDDSYEDAELAIKRVSEQILENIDDELEP